VGQFDAIYTFFLVLSLMLALASKPELSAVTFTLGILTKPQSIALLPLIAFLIFKKNGMATLANFNSRWSGNDFCGDYSV
jgi:uncharacterized membrane protein